MFATAIKAILGILSILGAWILVQGAWRRVFPGTPADEDVLANRIGCHGCHCKTPCDQFAHDHPEMTHPHSNHPQG